MDYGNKVVVFNILLLELENEVRYKCDSVEAKRILVAIKDFNKSYFKGMTKLSNNIMINEALKNN